MDRQNLWDTTMLIVCTDHGFLLGEHNRWAKNISTLWNEIARTPFFVWDPRCGKKGERRTALVQPALDLGPTLLKANGLELTPDMTGKDLTDAIANDTPVREAAAFGYFGYPLNVTDGEYVYMRNAQNTEVQQYSYSWTTSHMRTRFGAKAMREAEMGDPLPFSKGMPVPKFPTGYNNTFEGSPMLFNVKEDPAQSTQLDDPETEERLLGQLSTLMQEAHAPDHVFEKFAAPKI